MKILILLLLLVSCGYYEENKQVEDDQILYEKEVDSVIKGEWNYEYYYISNSSVDEYKIEIKAYITNNSMIIYYRR